MNVARKPANGLVCADNGWSLDKHRSQADPDWNETISSLDWHFLKWLLNSAIYSRYWTSNWYTAGDTAIYLLREVNDFEQKITTKKGRLAALVSSHMNSSISFERTKKTDTMPVSPKTITVANKQKNYKLTKTATLLTKTTSYEKQNRKIKATTNWNWYVQFPWQRYTRHRNLLSRRFLNGRDAGISSINFGRTSTTEKHVSRGQVMSKIVRLSHGKSAVYYLKVCTVSNCAENNRFYGQ